MTPLPPEAEAVAIRRAAEDRDLLARLRRSGRVVRVGPASALTRDVEARAFPPRVVNLAIRPRKRRR